MRLRTCRGQLPQRTLPYSKPKRRERQTCDLRIQYRHWVTPKRAQELGGRAAPLSSPECVVRSPEVSSRPRSPPIDSWNHWRKPTVHLVEELEPMFAHPTEGFMRGLSSVDTVVRVVHVQEADVEANCNP